MRFYWLALGILGTWRVTHLLAAEDGPFDAFAHLRRRAGAGAWGRMLDCFDCLSLLVAAPLAIAVGAGLWGRVLCWPALSAGAILLQRATAPAAPAVYYREDEETEHGLLRRDATASGGGDGAGGAP